MTAIDTWIADILQNRVSAADQPITGQVNNCVAAWQLVQAAIGGGPYLPLAGGTMTGAITAWSSGTAAAPSIVFGTAGLFPDSVNAGLGIAIGGAQIGYANAAGLTVAIASSAQIVVQSQGTTASRVQRFSNDAVSGAFTVEKARGTIAAPLVPLLNDLLGSFSARGYDGTSFTIGGRLTGTLIDTGAVGPAAMGTQLALQACAIGSGTLTTVAQLAVNQVGFAGLVLNGPLFTGGSGTTTKPYFLTEVAGTTVPTTWSTSGTMHGINAPAAFAGNFIDLHLAGGASLFKVDFSGRATSAADYVAGTGSFIGWAGKTLMRSPADGNLELTNNGSTGFSLLQFGGTTNSFPALKRNVTNLEVRLADDSADTNIIASGFVVSNAAFAIQSGVAFTNGAGASVGTLTNAPVAGNPTKWVAVNDNGTTRQMPLW